MTPADGLAEVGRRRMLVLGLLGALKALGIVLVADALAGGIVAVIAHHDITPQLLEGLGGALVRAASVWALRVASQSTAAGVKSGLRLRAARAMLRRGDGLGAETTVVTSGLDDLDAYYTSYLPALVTAATVPILVGVRILAADWLSALIIVLTVPLVPLFMALIGLHTRDRVAASLDALGRLSDHLVELARGLPVLVGLGRDVEQTRALADISEEHRARSMTALRTAFLSALALDLLSTISVAVVAVVVGIRLLHGDLPLQAGLVALILAPECYAPLREIGAAFHASDTGREALRRVRALFTRAEAEQPARAFSRGIGSTLNVRDLTVTHPQRSTPAVSSLSFTARPGRVTLLAGDSGAGKSTVLAVLAGRGAALEAAASISGAVASPPADQVVWMPQHPRFSSATLLDELAIYDHRGADAVRVLERVGLAALAGHSPDELSPGEARRLAFARVLAAVRAGCRLVLLDEPTAHLDPVSAREVRRELRDLPSSTTVVVASHDPLVRELADDVVAVTGSREASTPDAPRHPSPGTDEAASPLLASSPRDSSPSAPQDAAVPSPMRTRQVAAELVRFLRPVRARVLAATLVGALSTAFAIALTVVSGWLIVRASQEPAIMYLLVAIVGVRFFGIGRSALRYAERLLTHDAVLRAVTGLRLRLWRGLAANGPAGRAALSPANTLRSLIGAADRVRDLVPRVLQPPVTAAVVLFGAIVTLWLVFPPSAALLAGCGLVSVLAAPAIAIVAARFSAGRGEAARGRVLTTITGLLAARDDLTTHAADGMLDRLRSADAAAARQERRTASVEGATSALVTLACCTTAVLMLALSAGSVASGVLRPELVAVLALVPLAIIEPFSEAVTAATKTPALAEVLRVVGETTTRVDADDAGEEQALTDRLPAVDGVVLDDICFRYDGASDDVLQAVSGTAVRGEWLAVTGPSGSGKSTLLALLLRFIDPRAGRYRIRSADGEMDATALTPRAVRNRVAWCPQEGHLFDSTLRANLTIARALDDRPNDRELADAIARVGLAPLVASLPDGLDTRVGAGGNRLSGGQRQRLAVARTLLTRGDVVLIDEPTAHLDEQASAALMADLRGALTSAVTVLVTHDATEARTADHVISLARDGGEGADAPPAGPPGAALVAA